MWLKCVWARSPPPYAFRLMEAAPVLFLDNVNATNLRSDLLASVISEPNVDVRLLGVSRMFGPTRCLAGSARASPVLRPYAPIITCERDAKTEDPRAALRARLPYRISPPPRTVRGADKSAGAAATRFARPTAGCLRIGRDGFLIRSWRSAAQSSRAHIPIKARHPSERVSPPSSPSGSPSTVTCHGRRQVDLASPHLLIRNSVAGNSSPPPSRAWLRSRGRPRHDAFAAIVAATAEGELTPNEGTTMAQLVEGFAAVDAATEADRRARHRKKHGPFSDLDF